MVLSTLLQNHVVLFPTSEPHGPLSIYLLQSLVVLSFTSEPHGLLPIYFGAAWSPPSPPKPCGPPLLLWSRVVSSLLQSRMVSSSLQSRMVSSLLKPCGPPHYFEAAWSLLPVRATWSLLTLWLPGLGLNPSSHLPLQPISDSSYSQLHLPASLYSSSFTGLP